MDIKPITDELKSRMSEELDYNLEAANQRRFAKAFRDDPHFAVPDVLVNSEHVIVSEWMDGTPLSQIVASGTPEQRNAASERYLEFLLVGPVRAGLLHADPHPGNFRLLADGRLGVIDYGAVNRLPSGLPPAMGALVSAALRSEAGELERGLRSEGFIKPSMSLDAEALLEYLQPFIEPLAHAEFTFSRPWLRGVAAHVNDVRRPEFLVGMKLNLPPSYLLIHRVWLGGIGVLCQLGGTVPARQLVVDHMPGMQLRHLPPPLP
jgi:predicted unusual protein kinase regulating ubiquinone biosynthesis (AarF/ABC1/UbiB family)